MICSFDLLLRIAPDARAPPPLLHQLDVLRLYLYGSGKSTLFQVDYQALHLAASLAHQATGKAVEAATDNADFLAVKLRGNFIKSIVLHHLGLLHSLDEALHGIMSHGQGFILLATSHIAKLQAIDLLYNGFKFLARLVHEEQIGHVGYQANYTTAKLLEYLLLHRHKHTVLHIRPRLKHFVSRVLGIGPRQVSQHVPIVCNRIFNSHFV